jgi:hypothetical protein
VSHASVASPATIWKFPFRVDDVLEIEMPGVASILHVECQHGTPCVWAVVNPAAPKVIRRLRLFGTGRPITERLGRHIGTFQQGPFVWHVFEEVP